MFFPPPLYTYPLTRNHFNVEKWLKSSRECKYKIRCTTHIQNSNTLRYVHYKPLNNTQSMLLVCRDAQEVSKCLRGILCVFVSWWGWRRRRWVSFVAGGLFLVLRKGSKTHTRHTLRLRKEKYIYMYGWGWLKWRMWTFLPRAHSPPWPLSRKEKRQKKRKTVSEWQNLTLRYIPISFLSAYLRIRCIARAKTLPLPPPWTDR